jgi:hypothetical protein
VSLPSLTIPTWWGSTRPTSTDEQKPGQILLPTRSRAQSARCSFGARPVTNTRHGTSAGWHTGCRCTPCRRAHSDIQRAFGRARAQQRLPAELRQQLLDGIYAGKPFRTVLRELRLTPNRVWGLTKTDVEWSAALEAARRQPAGMTWSTEPTPPMCRVVSAANVASISGSGWLAAAARGL